MDKIPYQEIDYGFEYGAANITRVASDVRKGWVVIAIETPKSKIQVYVTKTGKVRVHIDGHDVTFIPK